MLLSRNRQAVAGLLFFVLSSCQVHNEKPQVLAKQYCQCLSERRNVEGQIKYIFCDSLMATKSELLRLYFEKNNADTLITYGERQKTEMSDYVAKFLSAVDKECPGW